MTFSEEHHIFINESVQEDYLEGIELTEAKLEDGLSPNIACDSHSCVRSLGIWVAQSILENPWRKTEPEEYLEIVRSFTDILLPSKLMILLA